MRKRVETACNILNTGCCGLKPLACMMMSLIIVGFLVLMVGFILVLSCSFYVPPKIKKYNSAVESWNKRYMHEFSKNDISVNITTNNDTVIVDLVPFYCEISNKGYPELHSYSDLRYERTITVSQIFDISTSDFEVTLIAAVPSTKAKYLPTIQVKSWLLSVSNPQGCEPGYYGFQINGTCYVLHKLIGICVKVDVTGSGKDRKFSLSPRYGGLGCQPTIDKIGGQLTTWDPGMYEVVSKVGVNDTIGNHLLSFAIDTVVRSVEDPYLVALELTGGKKFSSLYNDTIYLMNKIRVVGITLLVAGFLVMALFFFSFFCCCLCKRSRKYLVTIGLTEEQQLIYKYKEQEAQLKYEERYGEEARNLKRKHMKFHLFPGREIKQLTENLDDLS